MNIGEPVRVWEVEEPEMAPPLQPAYEPDEQEELPVNAPAPEETEEEPVEVGVE